MGGGREERNSPRTEETMVDRLRRNIGLALVAVFLVSGTLWAQSSCVKVPDALVGTPTGCCTEYYEVGTIYCDDGTQYNYADHSGYDCSLCPRMAAESGSATANCAAE